MKIIPKLKLSALNPSWVEGQCQMKHYPSVLCPLAWLPLPLSFPSPGEAEATCALQVEGWWLHCWTESDAHGAVIPAVINISGRFPVPSLLLNVKYPQATLSPHFNYSFKVISGWNQCWSSVYQIIHRFFLGSLCSTRNCGD